MKPRLSAVLPFAALLFVPGANGIDTSLVRESGPLTAEEEQRELKVPAGFEVQLFAAEPQIHKPVNLAFDDRGRLWVSSSHEYPHAAPRERWADAEGSRVKDSRDAIIILEDTDQDGRADKRTVFADGLNIPTGVLPYKTGCIAWSIPNLWFFYDTDGDGVCDRRQILFGPLGWEKDVHGNCSSYRLAPDGWVYATHGFSNQSHFKVRPENLQGAKPGDPGTELTLHSGNVFRFKPDGSRVELFSAGQVNPFGLAWDVQGNLYSADCHSAPIYQLLPGAVYPSFGKPDDGLGFAPVMMHHTHSSTGICGIHYLDRRTWGEAWHDRILIGNVVTSRINCDRVSFHGSTPVATEEPDFLSSDDPWFRPVDLRMGPDRAMYVADFYNKVIGHYEVPLEHPGRDKERGRIWRIVKSELPPAAAAAPNGIAALRFEARAGKLSEASLEKVRRWMTSGDPFETRAAVEALLRPVSVEWLPDLMAAWEAAPAEDVSLKHQLRIVIRRHLELPGAYAKVAALQPSPALRAEIAAISQSVSSAEAAPFLLERLRAEPGSAEAMLKSFSYLAPRLPAGELMRLAKERHPADPGRQADLLAAMADGLQEGGRLPAAELLGWGCELAAKLLDGATPAPAAMWTIVRKEGPGPAPWTLQKRPRQGGGEIHVISSLNFELKDPEVLTGTLRSPAFEAPARFSFLICGHLGFPDGPAHEKNFVRLVDAETGAELRRAFPPRSDEAVPVAWDLADLGGKKVRFELTDGDTGTAYAWLAAGEFDPAVLETASFAPGKERTDRLRRLAVLLKYAAPSGLRDRLAAHLPAPPPGPPSPTTPEMQAELDKTIAARTESHANAVTDKKRGAEMFATHCAACHAIGGKGALVGPQLDGIGNRGAARLIEDILDPNRNVDSHFRLHLISKKDGSSFAGLERGMAGEVLVGIDATGTEHRIPKGDILKNEETGLSLMPPAFAHAIPEPDFHHLLAWLLDFK